jgi:hypothetical protein
VVEAEEGDNMSELNPKERFLEKFITLVGKFEQETGAEIKNIGFERLNTTFPGNVTEETTITKIELEMR